jgi:hypothetical protein
MAISKRFYLRADKSTYVYTEEFIDAVADNLNKKL